MDMTIAIVNYLNLERDSFSVSKYEINGQRLKLVHSKEERTMVLCEAQATASAYLEQFERAMQYLIDKSREQSGAENLGLAIDVNAIIERQRNSYRSALKKYSRSIVFEDLALQLLLFAHGKIIRDLQSSAVNEYLINLDRNLAKLHK